MKLNHESTKICIHDTRHVIHRSEPAITQRCYLLTSLRALARFYSYFEKFKNKGDIFSAINIHYSEQCHIAWYLVARMVQRKQKEVIYRITVCQMTNNCGEHGSDGYVARTFRRAILATFAVHILPRIASRFHSKNPLA